MAYKLREDMDSKEYKECMKGIRKSVSVIKKYKGSSNGMEIAGVKAIWLCSGI